MGSTTRRLAAALGLAAALCVIAPTLAPAASGSPGTVVTSVVDRLDPSCGYSTSQVFRPFGDLAYYFLAPGGNAESNRWAASGGAGVVTGKGVLATGASSYSLPKGGTITSGAFCLNLDGPTVRFSVNDPGVRGAVLRLEALWTPPAGATLALPVAVVPSTTKGVRLVAPSLLLANFTTLLRPTRNTTIKLRFTSDQGAWQVDDVYVDPFKRV